MNNTVCRNFDYNKKADSILESLSLNCDKCEFDGKCDIQTAYHKSKHNVVSIEFADMKGEEDDNAT